MPVVRYQVAGAFGGRGVTAFTPAPPRTTSNFSLKMAQHQTPVHQPGTQGVPAPYDGVKDGDSAVAIDDRSSYYYPPRWYPQLGYAIQRIWDGNFGGVRVFSDNMMPVPAIDPRRLPGGVQGPVAQAGTMMPPARPNRRAKNRQIIWPARSTRWQGVNGG